MRRAGPKKKNSPDLFQDGLDRSWMDRANCRDLPTWMANALFFDATKVDPNRRAREFICGRCPVRLECWSYGEIASPEWGAWGGISEHRRRSDRRYRQTLIEPTKEMVDAER